jgi:hypothetical protein
VYLTGVIKRFAQQFQRQRQVEKAKLKKYAAGQPPVPDPGDEPVMELMAQEFSQHLKGELRRYFMQTCMGILPEGGRKEYSKQYSRKLEERLRKQWQKFFG